MIGNSNQKTIGLTAFILGMSAGVWLAVDANWVAGLGAVAKLGFGATGFGRVTIKLLVAAFAWSIGSYFAFKILLGLSADVRSIFKFATGIIVDLVLVGVVAFVAESWLIAHQFVEIRPDNSSWSFACRTQDQRCGADCKALFFSAGAVAYRILCPRKLVIGALGLDRGHRVCTSSLPSLNG